MYFSSIRVIFCGKLYLDYNIRKYIVAIKYNVKSKEDLSECSYFFYKKTQYEINKKYSDGSNSVSIIYFKYRTN